MYGIFPYISHIWLIVYGKVWRYIYRSPHGCVVGGGFLELGSGDCWIHLELDRIPTDVPGRKRMDQRLGSMAKKVVVSSIF